MVGRQVQASGPPQRIIELKVTLWQLVTAACLILGFGIGQYMKTEKTNDLVQQLSTEIISLRSKIDQGSAGAYTMSSTLALVQFRVEAAEADIRSLKNSPPIVPRKP